MAKTISTSSATGVTLTAGDNPVTVFASGTIDTGAGNYALLGSTGAYTITNSGLLRDTASTGVGIGLLGGGTVNNTAATAQIVGAKYGIRVAGSAGTINNYGTINVTGGSPVHFAQAIGLSSGGMVGNATGGVISGGVHSYGVYGATAVYNSGTITAGVGVVLSSGGTLNNSFIIQASYADAIDADASASITNSGRITGYNYGIVLKAGGSITNVSAAQINGASFAGIYAKGAFSISNSGSVVAGEEAILVSAGATGVITNISGALIQGTGDFGIVANGAGTIQNNGQIFGPVQAVYLKGGGTVTNQSTGIIHGNTSFGVDIKGGAGTVVNYGNITGGATAVALASGFTNLLKEFPGAPLNGTLNGGNTIGGAHTSTLYLGSAVSAGSISNVGVSVVNFGSVAFAPGSQWVVSGNTVGIAGGEVFGDFQVGDTIQITGVAGESISGYSAGTLTLSGGASLTVKFSGAQTANFHVQNDVSVPTATDITITLCYAEGTRILTETGEVPIELLREGDRVVTALNGPSAPIVWKGWRRVQPMRHPRPETMYPVLIRAGAFGEGKPHTDLRLSPDHAIYRDGVLVPARLLVNGQTIVRDQVADVTYYHLELPEHDVLLAQGLACESYLNTGDRSAFANGGGPVALHPDFVTLRWEGLACADLVLTGPRLERIRRDVAARVPGRLRRAA